MIVKIQLLSIGILRKIEVAILFLMSCLHYVHIC
jgi:hypothetical protein